MINTTRWKPDTCDCIFEYEWDTDEPDNIRVHTFKNVINKCSEHSGINQLTDVYANVLSENQTKNKVLGEILSKLPRIKKVEIDSKGETTEKLDPSIDYKYRFEGKDDNRVLKVELVGADLNAQEKNTLQVAVNKLDKIVEVI